MENIRRNSRLAIHLVYRAPDRTERTQIPFLSDVLVAVASMDLKVPINSMTSLPLRQFLLLLLLLLLPESLATPQKKKRQQCKYIYLADFFKTNLKKFAFMNEQLY